MDDKNFDFCARPRVSTVHTEFVNTNITSLSNATLVYPGGLHQRVWLLASIEYHKTHCLVHHRHSRCSVHYSPVPLEWILRHHSKVFVVEAIVVSRYHLIGTY